MGKVKLYTAGVAAKITHAAFRPSSIKDLSFARHALPRNKMFRACWESNAPAEQNGCFLCHPGPGHLHGRSEVLATPLIARPLACHGHHSQGARGLAKLTQNSPGDELPVYMQSVGKLKENANLHIHRCLFLDFIAQGRGLGRRSELPRALQPVEPQIKQIHGEVPPSASRCPPPPGIESKRSDDCQNLPPKRNVSLALKVKVQLEAGRSKRRQKKIAQLSKHRGGVYSFVPDMKSLSLT